MEPTGSPFFIPDFRYSAILNTETRGFPLPIPHVGYMTLSHKTPNAWATLHMNFPHDVLERVKALIPELRQRIYKFIVMSWDDNMQVPLSHVENYFGLARRNSAPLFEPNYGDEARLPNSYIQCPQKREHSAWEVFEQKAGLLDYFKPSEYFHLLDFARALFTLDFTTLNAELDAQSNAKFPRAEPVPSLYVDFMAWFWQATVLDLKGTPRRSIPYLRFYVDLHSNLRHISLDFHGSESGIINTSTKVQCSSIICYPTRNFVQLGAFLARNLKRLKTILLFVQITFALLSEVTIKGAQMDWVNALRQVQVKNEFSVMLNVQMWPGGGERFGEVNMREVEIKGRELLTGLMMPDSLRSLRTERIDSGFSSPDGADLSSGSKLQGFQEVAPREVKSQYSKVQGPDSHNQSEAVAKAIEFEGLYDHVMGSVVV